LAFEEHGNHSISGTIYLVPVKLKLAEFDQFCRKMKP